MKKVLGVLVLVLLVIVGYWFFTKSNQPNEKDLALIESVVPGSQFVRMGAAGDFLLKAPATDELKAVAAKKRTSAFLSAEITEADLSDEFVYINVIPYVALRNAGIEDRCFYRVFFGDAKDLANENYAVTLCAK